MTMHVRTINRAHFAAPRAGETTRARFHRRNPHLDALARFCKVVGAVALFALIMAGLLVLDAAIWIPHAHP
jgi:hypothetical protein